MKSAIREILNPSETINFMLSAENISTKLMLNLNRWQDVTYFRWQEVESIHKGFEAILATNGR